MKKSSRLLVLIPHYNRTAELAKTIASISSREAVDVLVVDDGSEAPPSEEDLGYPQSFNGHLHLLGLGNNCGITSALNHGLRWATQRGYEFVGRMDAGDTNIGLRFAKQVDFLDLNPSVALVGTWVEFVDECGNSLFTLQHPTANLEIQDAIYRFNPFVHPAVTYRLSAINEVGGYPEHYKVLQDWACFLAIAQKYEVANIPEVLVRYEVSSDSLSTRKRFQQSRNKVRLLVSHYRPNFNQTMGLAKNLALLLLPRAPLTYLKTLFYKGKI